MPARAAVAAARCWRPRCRARARRDRRRAGRAARAPRRTPTGARRRRESAPDSGPGDLIVAAPAWADPILRVHLGDLIPLEVAGAHGRRPLRAGLGGEPARRATHRGRTRHASAHRTPLRRADASAASSAPAESSATTSSRAGPTRASAGASAARRRRRLPAGRAIASQCPRLGYNFVRRQTGRGRHAACARRCSRSRSPARPS